MCIGNDHFIHATVAENVPYIHFSCLLNSDWNGTGKWKYRAARSLKRPLPAQIVTSFESKAGQD